MEYTVEYDRWTRGDAAYVIVWADGRRDPGGPTWRDAHLKAQTFPR